MLDLYQAVLELKHDSFSNSQEESSMINRGREEGCGGSPLLSPRKVLRIDIQSLGV